MRPGNRAFQHLEALGDLERRVVRQHHAAGADAQVLGRRRDLPDHDVGRRARDVGHVVMLGHPVAGEAEPVGETAEIDAVAQRLRAGDASGDGREVEDGKRRHGRQLARRRAAFAMRHAAAGSALRDAGQRGEGALRIAEGVSGRFAGAARWAVRTVSCARPWHRRAGRFRAPGRASQRWGFAGWEVGSGRRGLGSGSDARSGRRLDRCAAASGLAGSSMAGAGVARGSSARAGGSARLAAVAQSGMGLVASRRRGWPRASMAARRRFRRRLRGWRVRDDSRIAVVTGASGWIAATVRSAPLVGCSWRFGLGRRDQQPSLRSLPAARSQAAAPGDRNRRRTRTSVGATVPTAKRRSYITGTAARPRRASRSATGVIETGAACAAITGNPSWMSLSDAAMRRPAKTTTKPHRNVAAIRRKLGSMSATSISTPATRAESAYLSCRVGNMKLSRPCAENCSVAAGPIWTRRQVFPIFLPWKGP